MGFWFFIAAVGLWIVLQIKTLKWQNDLDIAVTELLKLHPELLVEEGEKE